MKPYSKNRKLYSKYKPPHQPKFILNHTLCRQIVPYARFLEKRNKLTMRQRIGYTRQQVYWEIFPKFLTDLIGVQPMTGPVGLIYTLRTKYGDPE